jgi:hypothetical protein
VIGSSLVAPRDLGSSPPQLQADFSEIARAADFPWVMPARLSLWSVTLAFRCAQGGFPAPVSARYFPISVSAEGRLVRQSALSLLTWKCPDQWVGSCWCAGSVSIIQAQRC